MLRQSPPEAHVRLVAKVRDVRKDSAFDLEFTGHRFSPYGFVGRGLFGQAGF